ncbi:MAG: SDR family NAD(P)-dependent oxidoreductase, partial [Candidatus Omnitrophica bacterium]|nr:SDR family NAD(P)-dependent oxidoreductase [Candidatus Omnitrophota bacterium]
MKLENKVSLITGGGRGIGLAISTAFAEAGSNLAICDVSEAALQSAQEQLSKTGRTVLTGKVDVTKYSEVEAFIQKILDKF